MVSSALNSAIQTVPSGAWAIAVSGGADSVALLHLLGQRADLSLHVVHLDHQTRNGESAADAQFVTELAAKWGLPSTIAIRSDEESESAHLEKNLSARYRAARLVLFRRVIAQHRLRGVILAHHADDQAETVLLRLMRGCGSAGLIGMSPQTTIGGVLILRPLLGVRREELRRMLCEQSIAWREDASNAQPQQQRNRVRQMLADEPTVTEALLGLSRACSAMTHWLRQSSPRLDESFDPRVLDDLPAPLAREAARRWLSVLAGADVEITAAAVARLLEMSRDAASPARQHFPGGVLVSRRRGEIASSRVSRPESRQAPAEDRT